MESRRQSKVSRLLLKELADIFQREDQLKVKGAFTTVTMVRISPDLLNARVYLSVFPTKFSDELMQIVQAKTSEIRGILGHRIRHQLKGVPELHFFHDDSLDYASRIDELLR